MTSKKTNKLPEIEDDLKRLESILKEMENHQLPLNTLMERYEEGSGLLKNCLNTLNLAKKRIQLIQLNLDKTPQEDDNSLNPEDSPANDGQLL